MKRNKAALFSSTPYSDRNRRMLSLFEDITQFSPITEPSQPEVPVDPKPIPLSSVPSSTLGKKRVKSKVNAVPESVAGEVLKELGVAAEDICNNALSHSRNLYNMFPEPIILDSDEETTIVTKKPLMKPKQDSKIVQPSTSKSREERKLKECVPGSSRTSRLTRPAADRKTKKQSSVQTLSSAPAKDLKTATKTKYQSRSKLPVNRGSSPSVVVVDDDDSLFPMNQPGTSIYRTTKRNKIKDVLLSLELDEKFPIEWSARKKKTVDNKTEKVSEVENSGAHESKDSETNNNKKETIKPCEVNNHKAVSRAEVLNGSELKCSFENIGNIDGHVVNGVNGNVDVDENKDSGKRNNKKETVKPRLLRKAKVLNGFKPLCSGNENAGKDDRDVNKEKENQVLISHFKDVRFKLSNTCGGIIAQCLKTDQNDVGYLEVPAKNVFNGKKTNITFVVIEGEANVLHLGKKQTLSPGDMIHIIADDGYQFESAGAGHVRFLYIKAH